MVIEPTHADNESVVPTEESAEINDPTTDPAAAEQQAAEASAADVLAETLQTETEAREPKDIQDLRWVHIEDDDDILEGVEAELKDVLGMENKIGQAHSYNGAVALINRLVTEGEKIDLVISDQQILKSEGSEGIADERFSEQFFIDLQKAVKENPQIRAALKDTVFVMLSGTADDIFINVLRDQCPDLTIIGRIDKSFDDEGHHPRALKQLLEEQGVVRAQ